MEKNPETVAWLAAQKEDENWRFRSFLKMLPPRRRARADALATQLGRDAEAQMDCTTCGACCRANHVPVTDVEIERLAGRVQLPVLSFHERYLDTDDDGEPAIDANPCPFLEGTRCSVYEDRPEPCRAYPYIGGDVAARMIGIIERAGTCPIVFEMVEQLKRRLVFRRYC